MPLSLKLLSAALVVVTAIRPQTGLLVLAGLLPITELIKINVAPPFDPWQVAEILTVSFLAPAGVRLALGPDRRQARLWRPALILGALVAASVAISISRQQQQSAWLGTFVLQLWRTLPNGYFVDARSFVPLHGGVIWIEALVLAVIVERLLRNDGPYQQAVARLVLIGAAAAASRSAIRLAEISLRSVDPLAAAWGYFTTQRIAPQFSDLNAAGSYYVLLAVPAAYLCLHAKHWWRWLPVAMLTGLALWLTGSRTAFVAFVVALAVTWLVSNRPTRATLAVVAFAAVAGIGWVVFGPARTTQTSSDQAMSVRREMVVPSLRMTATSPIFGVGLGEFQAVSRAYVSPERVKISGVAATGENAHNNFLQILAELGITGLVAFLWLVATPFVAVLSDIRAGAASRAMKGFAGGVLAFLITCLGGHPLLSAEVTLMFLLVVGVTVGLSPPTLAAPGASATVPTQRGAFGTWLIVTLILISVPPRMWWTRSHTQLDGVTYGASRYENELDGVRYRSVEPSAAWFIGGTTRVVTFPLRLARTANVPCVVDINVDGRRVDSFEPPVDAWRRAELPLPDDSRSRTGHQIEFRTITGCEVIVGRPERR